eukprot:COSAG02_NODE_2592_length_8465_cov_2.118695_3_plen_54_part_00
MQTSELFLRITQAQFVSPAVGAGTSSGADHGPSVLLDQRMNVLRLAPGLGLHC